jgi:hypothetical protein
MRVELDTTSVQQNPAVPLFDFGLGRRCRTKFRAMLRLGATKISDAGCRALWRLKLQLVQFRLRTRLRQVARK